MKKIWYNDARTITVRSGCRLIKDGRAFVVLGIEKSDNAATITNDIIKTPDVLRG